MPSHELHMKWEKKLGLPSDKKLHGIIDNLQHHDAKNKEGINPFTPYYSIIKDSPKRIAKRYTTIWSGLYLVFEDLREHYNVHSLSVVIHKRVALHLILDGIADVIREDLGLTGLEKSTPEKIVEMGYYKMYEKMYEKGSPTIRDFEEDKFRSIAAEVYRTLREKYASEVLEDIVDELKDKRRLRLVGYNHVYNTVSRVMRELKPYLNYPTGPSFNLENLIRQIASYLSKGLEVEVPIMWRKGNQRGFEILKVKSLDEFLQKIEEFKRVKLGLK